MNSALLCSVYRTDCPTRVPCTWFTLHFVLAEFCWDSACCAVTSALHDLRKFNIQCLLLLIPYLALCRVEPFSAGCGICQITTYTSYSHNCFLFWDPDLHIFIVITFWLIQVWIDTCNLSVSISVSLHGIICHILLKHSLQYSYFGFLYCIHKVYIY